LLAGAREDNLDLVLEILDQPGSFDINYADGLGNTALHYAASSPSPDVIEHLLSADDCDVDPINRISKSTPLHLAVQIKIQWQRLHIVKVLLEAGADTDIKDSHGSLAVDFLPSSDTETRAAIREAKAQTFVSHADVVHESDDELDPDEVPSDDD